MSLKKKIVFSFFISSFIIALLMGTEYVNFTGMKKEIHNLETADTIRSQSLQLRRHEKNFFLYIAKADEEAGAVYRYLGEMDALFSNRIELDSAGNMSALRGRLKEYRGRFKRIQLSINSLSDQFGNTGHGNVRYRDIYSLIQLTFREHPLEAAGFLEKTPLGPREQELIEDLRKLDLEIQALRKNGEDILGLTEELGSDARGNMEHAIGFSQIAILAVFPIFFISGVGTLFLISRNVVNRLKLLTSSVERTGKGRFPLVASPPVSRWGNDEVEVLIKEFNSMEEQLAQREGELSEELQQSKKLAAIGTLASGVAHELNNPINNICISAQILEKEARQGSSPFINEAVSDIIGQSRRVKNIVEELLEFARVRDLCPEEVNLSEIIMEAYKMVSTAADRREMDFAFDAVPEGAVVQADQEELERVFINLFSNAVDAMKGSPRQILRTRIAKEEGKVIIMVSDTGSGIPADSVDKIFEPFYSTKDKGTGLGLAIVFNIIKRHNGEIRVESTEGKGTTFIITLPVMQKKDN